MRRKFIISSLLITLLPVIIYIAIINIPTCAKKKKSALLLKSVSRLRF